MILRDSSLTSLETARLLSVHAGRHSGRMLLLSVLPSRRIDLLNEECRRLSPARTIV